MDNRTEGAFEIVGCFLGIVSYIIGPLLVGWVCYNYFGLPLWGSILFAIVLGGVAFHFIFTLLALPLVGIFFLSDRAAQRKNDRAAEQRKLAKVSRDAIDPVRAPRPQSTGRLWRISLILIFLPIVGFGVHLWTKSSIVIPWTPPESTAYYQITGYDGTFASIALRTNGTALYSYYSPRLGYTEHALVKVHGRYSTNLFGSIWYITPRTGPRGLRSYPADVKPVQMELEVLSRYTSGSGPAKFPDIGERRSSMILIGPSRIHHDDMWFGQAGPDYLLMSEALQKLHIQ